VSRFRARRLHPVHRGAGASRVATVACPRARRARLFSGGSINGDVERLLAETARRLEELERAGVDGFDRALVPRVEWL
jgi:hypothetical protein